MLRGVTLELRRSDCGVTPVTPDRRTARVTTSGTRARSDCVSANRLGSSLASGFVIPVREVAACDRLIQTSDFASYRASCCAEYRNAAAGTTSSGRMTIHLRRRTTAR